MTLENEKLLIHVPLPAPPGWLEKARARFPGLEIVWERSAIPRTPEAVAGTGSAADGTKKSGPVPGLDDLPDDVVQGVTILCPSPLALPSPERMKDVRFVQLISAGSDLWASHDVFRDDRVAFCSASGIHAPQIAEWVIGTWLSHVNSLRHYVKAMDAETWSPLMDLSKMGADSVGRRIGILGYGAIGRHVARLASAFGMEVYVHTHTPRPTPESRIDNKGYTVPGTGDPQGLIPARWFSGDLDSFLAEDLDIVVVATALTPETRGMIGRRQLEIMGGDNGGNKKAFLSNVARGPIVDTDALIEALQGGVIAGAALDVTDPEPLPQGHPLWTAPNVFITPHVSWQSTNITARAAALLFENLERLDRGDPLLNIIRR